MSLGARAIALGAAYTRHNERRHHNIAGTFERARRLHPTVEVRFRNKAAFQHMAQKAMSPSVTLNRHGSSESSEGPSMSDDHKHALAAAHNAQLSWMAAAEEEVRMQPAPLALRPAARALPARC